MRLANVSLSMRFGKIIQISQPKHKQVSRGQAVLFVRLAGRTVLRDVLDTPTTHSKNTSHFRPKVSKALLVAPSRTDSTKLWSFESFF